MLSVSVRVKSTDQRDISLSLSLYLPPVPSLCFAGAAQASAVQSNSKQRLGRRERGESAVLRETQTGSVVILSDSLTVKHSQVTWRDIVKPYKYLGQIDGGISYQS